MFLKDVDSILDYGVNWDEWVEEGEAITSHTITAEAGITVDSSTESSGIVTIWLSGGTSGTTYNVACKIITDKGRTEERSILIKCLER